MLECLIDDCKVREIIINEKEIKITFNLLKNGIVVANTTEIFPGLINNSDTSKVLHTIISNLKHDLEQWFIAHGGIFENRITPKVL